MGPRMVGKRNRKIELVEPDFRMSNLQQIDMHYTSYQKFATGLYNG